MPQLPHVLTATLLVLASGCASTMKISSDYDHSAHFGGLKTYAWMPGAQSGLEDPRMNAALIDPNVRADVNKELAAKGYVLQPAGNVDFMVSYHVSMEDESKTQHVGDAPIYDAYAVTFADGKTTAHVVRNSGAVSYLDSFRVGTLLLRITDPKTKNLIWHGAAEAQLTDNATPEQKKQRLEHVIHLILDRFPPK